MKTTTTFLTGLAQLVAQLAAFSAAPSLLSSAYGAEYGKPEYWEKRYEERQGETYEWLQSFHDLEEFFHKYVRDVNWQHEKVLDFGFGSADTAWQMHQSEGIFAQDKTVYGIDISHAALAAKHEKHPPATYPLLQYRQGDATAMEEQPRGKGEVLDFVIDKSTTDAFYCESGDLVRRGRDEVYRVLNKQRGLWFYITYGAASDRESVSLEQPRTAMGGDGKKSWAAVHICQKGTHRVLIMMAGENYADFRKNEKLKTEYSELASGVDNCIDVTHKFQIAEEESSALLLIILLVLPLISLGGIKMFLADWFNAAPKKSSDIINTAAPGQTVPTVEK